MLEDKRSAATRRNYAADLKYFFVHVSRETGADVTPQLVTEFLSWPPPRMAGALVTWKSGMLQGGLSEATVNRRLAAVKSLLKFAHRLGLCATDGRSLIDGERVQAYRDTRGIGPKQVRELLSAPATAHGAETVHGLRDTALLLLLCENVLRRNEAALLDVSDFSPATRELQVLRKGKGSQKVRVTLSPLATQVLAAYLSAAGHTDGPLLRNLSRDPDATGGRLSGEGLRKIVRGYGRTIGVPNLAPHKLRHSGITAALEAGWDVREVMKLSGHAKLETLLIYDDARRDVQGDVTGALSDLFAGKKGSPKAKKRR